MVQLPPTEFTFGKYGNNIIPFDIYAGDANYFLKWLLTQNVIGYCNSMECKVKPRIDEMAVMFEKDNWQGWGHIPMDVWQEYLKQFN